jgi:PKD repeat protein
MNIKFLTLIFVLIFSVKSLYGQQYPHCGTEDLVEQSMKDNPEYFQNYRRLLNEIAANRNKNTSDVQSTDSVLIIPVVVHIIHDTGPENISFEQIQDAIRILNEDFNFRSSDTGQILNVFRPIAANCHIEFRLARLDPQGNCTNGFTRTQSALTASAGDNVKNLSRWPSDRYLNVWVVRNIASGAGAYAYLPGTTSAANDGIVTRASQFGSIGASSSSNFAARTFTHEVGHYLGLRHTWGPTNEPGLASNCNFDDGIDDTPNTIGIANQSCNKNFTSCGGILANVENYMDYSSCGRMFTEEQKSVMRAVLASSVSNRNNLVTLSNRLLTGTNNGYTAAPCAPRVDFTANTQSICEGGNVNFTGFITNGPEDPSFTYSWEFEGGTPATSNLRTPQVSYASAGNFRVKLRVFGPGGQDSVVRNSFIEVRPTTPVYQIDDTEPFTEASFPIFPGNAAKNWTIEAANANNTWRRSTAAFVSEPASLFIQNRSLSVNTVNSIISPFFDATTIASSLPVILKFKLAFARRNTANSDRLRIYTSSTCGSSWVQKYNKTANGTGSNALRTTETLYTSNIFVPTADEWREETVNLLLNSSQRRFQLKFELTSGGGNNMYIDDIQITTLTSLDDAITSNAQAEWQVFPNPTEGAFTARFYMSKAGSNVLVRLYDMTGKMLANKNPGYLSEGIQEVSLSQTELKHLKQGIYRVELIVNGVRYTKPLVVQ